ncbi:MAG: hypothetical protein ACP5GZ_11995, partial [Vulcanisaeta sp.]
MSLAQVNINKSRICWGVSRGRRLYCGELVTDEAVIKEVIRLINEFLIRVKKHRSMLLSYEITPFDDPINALSDLLKVVVAKGDKAIVKLRAAEREVGERMLELLSQAKEKWLKVYKSELVELIERLRKG